MPMKPAEMIRFLQKNGFIIKEQNKSSHVVLVNPLTGKTTMVPMHKSKELRKGTEQIILKQAGLK